MISLIIGIVVSLVVTIVGTPLLIRLVHKLNYGQYIRQDGPKSHLVKRGTPTLGGVVINLAVVLGWGSSALYRFVTRGETPSWSAVLVLFAMLSMGLLGFIDDFAKVRKKQSEGLTVKGKFIGQFILATIYAVLALILPTNSGFPSAQAGMSFIEEPFFSFEFAGKVVAIVLFVIWVNFLMTAWTNAINLTDGLDGLAAGVGFLRYNSNPASIFMGDTGSLALGGLFAAMSFATHTEFLAIILGGLFVMETLSDVIQVGYFKMTHKRVFKMAPIHHHFELKGWPEVKVVIRFWMIELLFVLVALVLFYGDWVARSGL